MNHKTFEFILKLYLSNETKEFTIDDVVTQDWCHNPNATPKTKSVLKKIQTEESSEEDSD